MPGDLHTHTTFSDGSTPVEKMPFLARCAGMTHLAVSDHDSMRGVRYAYAHPVQEGVHLIQAVELPAYDDTCNAASGWKTWDGTEEITAKTGDKIVVVEIDEDALAKKAGTATVAAKEATQTLSGQNAAPARGNTESEDED